MKLVTTADHYRANALHEVGEDYVWGAEGRGGVEGDDDYDCSGFTWAMLHNVGVKIPRLTAEGYRRMGHRITRPTLVGADFAVLLNKDGRAHHIIPFIGKGQTVEAKGKAYGVVKSTVTASNKRGAKWYRFPNVNLGVLTDAAPAPSPRKYPGHVLKLWHKHHDEVRWVQKRLVAHGYKGILVDGAYGLKTQAAVKSFRREQFRGVQRGNVGPKTWARLAQKP